MTWPAHRQKRFIRMWERGERPGVIAAAFGITIDAVTGRARYYKLKPRRVAEYASLNTRRPPKEPTPWEVRPLPEEPSVALMSPDEQRYWIWKRARDGAREALNA